MLNHPTATSLLPESPAEDKSHDCHGYHLARYRFATSHRSFTCQRAEANMVQFAMKTFQNEVFKVSLSECMSRHSHAIVGSYGTSGFVNNALRAPPGIACL